MYVSYNFKTALDYSSIYRSIHFWYHDTTLEKIFSKEKLNLTRNKQIKANQLYPLPPYPFSPAPAKNAENFNPPFPSTPTTHTHTLLSPLPPPPISPSKGRWNVNIPQDPTKLTLQYFWVDLPGWGQGMGTGGGGSGWWGFHHHSHPLIFKYFSWTSFIIPKIISIFFMSYGKHFPLKHQKLWDLLSFLLNFYLCNFGKTLHLVSHFPVGLNI